MLNTEYHLTPTSMPGKSSNLKNALQFIANDLFCCNEKNDGSLVTCFNDIAEEGVKYFGKIHRAKRRATITMVIHMDSVIPSFVIKT